MRLAFGSAVAAAAAEADSVFPERAFSLLPPPQKGARIFGITPARPLAQSVPRSLGGIE